jgi:DNA-binding transcriptional LysR family regulator
MRKLDSTSARIFLTIAEEGSIAKAALREHIVPSAVSKRLSDLEAQVGVALVERGQHGIRLTPAGEAMVHHARVVMQALDTLQAEMSEYVQGVRGHIRVRASASSLAAGLPLEIRSFLETQQGIKIDLEELETPAIIRDVIQGRADIGICPDIADHSGLKVIPYKPYDLTVAVPARHPLSRRKKLRYEQILQFDQVEQNRASALAQLLDQAAKRSPIPKKTRIRVRGFDTVCSMIGMGMGVGIVPSSSKTTHGDAHGLIFVPLSDAWAHSNICVMIRSYEELPSAARLFVEYLESTRKNG